MAIYRFSLSRWLPVRIGAVADWFGCVLISALRGPVDPSLGLAAAGFRSGLAVVNMRAGAREELRAEREARTNRAFYRYVSDRCTRSPLHSLES